MPVGSLGRKDPACHLRANLPHNRQPRAAGPGATLELREEEGARREHAGARGGVVV